VGNVPVGCCKDRKLARKLCQLFVNPVESLRFRSVAFETPQARKAAFITQALRKSVTTCNAFVVMKQREDAVTAVNTLNGSVFEDHHLRVDFATAPRLGQKNLNKKAASASGSATATATATATGTDSTAATSSAPAPVNTKKSVFLGNLDLELEEEPVWRFFGDLCGRVTNVRLIRDRSTNLGKGIGYVTFAERDSVQLALQLDGRMLKERPVRVQPCCKPGMVEKKKERQAKLAQQREAQKRGLRNGSKGAASSQAIPAALGAPKKIASEPVDTGSFPAKSASTANGSKFGKAFEKRVTNKFPFSSVIEGLKAKPIASKDCDAGDKTRKTGSSTDKKRKTGLSTDRRKTDSSTDKTRQKRKGPENTSTATKKPRAASQ
jgi:nucleolar protein 12